MVDSWGYSMTIVDFYQVIRLTPKGAVVKPMTSKEEATGYLSGHAMPGTVIDGAPESRVQAREYGWVGTLNSDSGQKLERHTVRKWDGKPEYYNHCD